VFLRLYGDTVLGRVLSRKVCDLDREGGHYDVCRSITNPTVHAWAFAWGMAFGLSKPEWAAQVLSEFNPGWQSPSGEGEWPLQIDDAIRHNPAEGHL
jgi:hypothetical protein